MTPTTVYLDANFFIHAVEGEDSRLLLSLRTHAAAGCLFITSELTLAEVLIRPIQDGASALVALYEDLLGGEGLVETSAVDRHTLRRSAEIRAWLGGKLPDTVHVATALLSGCSTILSSDQRLRLPPGLSRMPVETFALSGLSA